jgi:hypothetical protein
MNHFLRSVTANPSSAKSPSAAARLVSNVARKIVTSARLQTSISVIGKFTGGKNHALSNHRRLITMPTQAPVTRATLLREQIASAEVELRQLDADADASARMRALGKTLIDFRQTVNATKTQVASFDSQIDGCISKMKAAANASISTGFGGLVGSSAEELAKVDSLVSELKNLLLARARAAHQLTALEARLAGEERANLQRPAKYRV